MSNWQTKLLQEKPTTAPSEEKPFFPYLMLEEYLAMLEYFSIFLIFLRKSSIFRKKRKQATVH